MVGSCNVTTPPSKNLLMGKINVHFKSCNGLTVNPVGRESILSYFMLQSSWAVSSHSWLTHETTGLFAFQIKSGALDWDVDEQLFGSVPWKISRKKQT